jgi:Ca2+-binding RTX toxin-like protein
MVLTRATVTAGVDGIMGTPDDVRPVNTTTPFVDQNQTYTSHPSHQVFVRQYVLNSEGKPVSTGNLIEGLDAAGGTTGVGHGGMATWGEVKAQTLQMLGIQLVDQDVGKVPLLRTDAYGNFIPDPVTGFAQVVIGLGVDGIPNTADDIVVSGTPSAPILLATAGGVGAVRTNSAFLADIAHTAVPNGIADGDITIGLGNLNNEPVVYDNELLDAHFIAGDGRVNENIGLTAVHHIFHSEHNRMAAHTKDVVLADAAAMLAAGSTQAEAVAFLNEWLIDDVAVVPANGDGLIWDGGRIFQAAKFGTEMQYQHLVFEDFARKIQPNIDFFVVPDGYHADINPSITAEFAHVVYRFGHSMLTEQIDRFDTTFTNDQIGLVEAFLNPVAFDAGHTVADGIAAGDIIRGMTRQVGNEIDEFVTGALRNNLLGLPLDLATINLARGRDTGVPSLNATRREFYTASNQAPELKPYESWVDFAANLKNEASIINFVAAYGTHGSITSQTTIDGKRDAAMTLIFGQSFGGLPIQADAADFLNGTGAWANNADGSTITGLDIVDLWIGGLAEKTMVGGGMLGATFNFVFEVQMEKLQDGDRFYYLQRLDGLHFLAEMENNTFAKVIQLNTNATHLPSDVFSAPGLILEVDQSRQYNDLNGDGIMEQADPTGGGILTPVVVRNNPGTPEIDTNYLKYSGVEHVILGGTAGNDTIISSEGDDTLYGDAGNDRLEGGQGNDSYIGGDGDDIITDLFGDDIIRSGTGNDAINAGVGTDLVIADEGNDFVVLGADLLDETFLGLGNDYVLGSKTTEMSLGGEGDDWIEIGAWTGAVGDNFDDQFAADSVRGHDVFSGDGGFDEFIGEGGDDIWNGTLGRGKFDGMSGFDWATYKDYQFGANADLTRVHFDALPLPPPNAALDEYSFVEGVSGSAFDDQILGSDATDLTVVAQGGARGSVLEADGIALIAGLQEVLGAGVDSFSDGNILLGGSGSDVITGRGGNDIIDGDKWLNVRIGVHEFVGADGGVGGEIDSADSMSELVTEIFNGTYNPGQLRIHREILNGGVEGDVDVAVFRDVRANYDITYNANGTFTVVHARGTQVDGTDTLRNIERVRFTDIEIALNVPATGAGVISDLTPTEGLLLSVDTSSIADVNGLGAFSYQWQSSANGTVWADIAAATAATFTPEDLAGITPGAQAGLQLRVAVSFNDGNGTPETVFSAPTGVVGLNWQGPNVATTFTGNAGDDIANGGTAGDTLNGNAGNDLLNGNVGSDLITGGAGNDTVNGGAGGTDTVNFAGAATNFGFNTTGAAVGSVTITDGTGAEGTDTVTGAEVLRFNGSNYTVVNGTNGGNTVASNLANFFGLGQQAIFGYDGADALNGGLGNDIIDAGDGTDTITQTGATGGRDVVNGGAGNDTYVINGIAGAETFRIYTRAAAITAGMTITSTSAEIIITRNGTTTADIVAELDNIEEITVNALNVTVNDGNGVLNTGVTGGDTVAVFGDFTGTSLNYSTITVDGSDEDDVVDITGLESEHHVVFNAGTGNDAFIGQRVQDELNDVNEAPVITSAIAFNVAENTSAVTTITANDINAGTTLTYSKIGGADADKFNLSAAGVLSFIASPNFEALADVDNNNVYDVIVQVSDGTLTDTQALAVTVTDVNEAPVITSAAAFNIAENSTAVGTMTATDVEGAALTYSISGTDVAKFSIDPVTGALSFNNSPDFEAATDAGANNVYDIIVGASDGTTTSTQALAVTVSDIVENLAPTNINWNGVVPSNTALPGAGVVIANLSTTDPDLGDTFTYTLEPGSSAGFTVSAAGVVTRTGAAMANNTTYTLNVRTTDAAGVSLTETFNIRTGAAGAQVIAGAALDDVLYGMQGNDNLSGNGGDDTLFGQAGNDTLNGGAGNDNLNGGSGNDTVNGDAGNDTVNYVIGDGIDTVNGGADLDKLSLTGTAGADSLDVIFNGTSIIQFEGGTVTNVESVIADMLGGTDMLDYNGTTAAVNVNLTANTASGFTSIASIESARGGSGNDTLTGNALANNLDGGNGNDTLIATVDNVRDNFGGNGGTDTADYSVYTANLAAVLDGLVGGSGSSTANSDTLSSIENFISGIGNDTITGNGSNNALNGGAGNDVITGAGGADVLTGGADADTFDFNATGESGIGAAARDLITDFVSGIDKLDFSTIDARTGFGVNAGNNAFVFNDIAGAAITDRGQLVYHYEGSGATAITVIQGNVNAALGADFEVALTGHIVFNAATDLVL